MNDMALYDIYAIRTAFGLMQLLLADEELKSALMGKQGVYGVSMNRILVQNPRHNRKYRLATDDLREVAGVINSKEGTGEHFKVELSLPDTPKPNANARTSNKFGMQNSEPMEQILEEKTQGSDDAENSNKTFWQNGNTASKPEQLKAG